MACYWLWIISVVTTTTAYKIGECNVNIFEVFINCASNDGGKTVNCTRNNLPGHFQDTLTENVHNLYLVDCCLLELNYDTFAKAIHIRNLEMRLNFLKSFDYRLFEVTTELSRVDISHNKLETLDYRLFERTNELYSLDLGNNFLKSLDYRIFRGKKKLSVLRLDHNNLNSLDYAVFNGLSGLTNLHLNYNSLTELDFRLFSETIKLQYLDLSHNKIEVLDYRIFDALRELSFLSLNFNSLATMDNRLFSALVNLRYLNLGNNKLGSLGDVRMFASQRALETLLLGGNSISNIDVNELKPLGYIEVLDLADNPLLCDCKFYMTILWTLKKGIENTNATCRHPQGRMEMSWRVMNSTENCATFNEENPSFEILTIALIIGVNITTVLLFVVCCISICLWNRYNRSTEEVTEDARRPDIPTRITPPLRKDVTENTSYDDVGPYYHENQEKTSASNHSYLSFINSATGSAAIPLDLRTKVNGKQYDYAYIEGFTK